MTTYPKNIPNWQNTPKPPRSRAVSPPPLWFSALLIIIIITYLLTYYQHDRFQPAMCLTESRPSAGKNWRATWRKAPTCWTNQLRGTDPSSVQGAWKWQKQMIEQPCTVSSIDWKRRWDNTIDNWTKLQSQITIWVFETRWLRMLLVGITSFEGCNRRKHLSDADSLKR